MSQGARAASAATTDEACPKARRRREKRARRSQPPDRSPQPPWLPRQPPKESGLPAADDTPVNVAAEILRRGDDAAVALRLRSETERLDVSRGELRQRVRQLAAALGRLGIQEEQRVLVVLPDGPEYVYAFLGAIWAGAVPVLVTSFLRPADYLPFVRETRARAVITSEAVADILAPEMRLGRLAPAVLTVGPGRSGSLWREVEGGPAAREPFPAHPHDPAFRPSSSRAAGPPKGRG